LNDSVHCLHIALLLAIPVYHVAAKIGHLQATAVLGIPEAQNIHKVLGADLCERKIAVQVFLMNFSQPILFPAV
jgi:hypothetical protein